MCILQFILDFKF